ncbi:hypothetical protein OG777_14775 [Micromonospora peucetia]|uniref:hypothetical protein n=1 Tax=Micromonospora peucetia TaxID=47871 RepID=UPI002258F816|nr:hypothetical protein [Micromonospora peucetia]MCX4388186.1 hypothetical protein [Micromonospora peucetia]
MSSQDWRSGIPPATVWAALYLDFDNVFSGLYKLDPDVAVHFAEDPGGWLHRLATTATTDGKRRWLVLRCYLNPAGWVYRTDLGEEQPRLYFSKFRLSFADRGHVQRRHGQLGWAGAGVPAVWLP